MSLIDGVTPSLAAALEKRGYTVLTPVQTAMLAPELETADALVSAQTGSGKTVAFGMAIAPTLLEGKDRFTSADVPQALIIAPTRELALQVKSELEWLYEMTGASVVSCVGGMDMRTERRDLSRGAHIVVGTPGRLRDHIERGSFDTSRLKCVVMDEADEMLDMGFRDDLEYILDTSPKTRRTLMFSATVPRSIVGLAKRYQRDAIRISLASDQKQHADIEYRALLVAPNDRQNAIINLLRFFDAKNAIVFCNTRATVNQLTSRLNNRGFSVVALSGELSQNERTHALQAMRDGRARVCVATDVAARGIDLPNLELVIHADLPRGAEPLLHRSGRTGRAGRKGVSALIVPHNWRKKAERLLSSAKVKASWIKAPSIEDIAKRDHERFMSDPALSDPIQEEEQPFITELLEKHSAEQIAAALVRIHNTAKPAAEELLDAGPAERPQKEREFFKDGVWFSLSVGRQHTAEPRWLLPMLCRAGHITKNEIGSIKIHEEKTFVELAPGCVDQFLEAIGPSRKMEKTVEVQRLDGIPKEVSESGGDRRPRGGDRKSRDGDRRSFGPKREFERKARHTEEDTSPRDRYKKKADWSEDSDRPKKRFDKRDDKRDGKRDDKRDDRPDNRSASDENPRKRFEKRDERPSKSERPARDSRPDDRSAKRKDAPSYQDRAREVQNKRFGNPEKPSERFKKKPEKSFEENTHKDAEKPNKKTLWTNPDLVSDDGKAYSKFNAKPKDKKAKSKKPYASKTAGSSKSGLGTLKRKNPKPSE